LPHWIGSHVHTFAFYGAVVEILVPDKLRSGTRKVNFYVPDINPTYQEITSHYSVAVITARATEPCDKAWPASPWRRDGQHLLDTIVRTSLSPVHRWVPRYRSAMRDFANAIYRLSTTILDSLRSQVAGVTPSSRSRNF
jgi:hypothetical protein